MTESTQKPDALQSAILNRKLIEAKIIAYAWADDAFRNRLLENPTEAFEAEGIPAPTNKKIKIVAEDENTIQIVIPAQSENEVSDAELAEVAGGTVIKDGKCHSAIVSANKWDRGDKKGAIVDFFVSNLAACAGFSWLWE